MEDLYKLLQVRPGADEETIAAAYARLRRRYDPALGGGSADAGMLRKVDQAYATLSDYEARLAYDSARGDRATKGHRALREVKQERTMPAVEDEPPRDERATAPRDPWARTQPEPKPRPGPQEPATREYPLPEVETAMPEPPRFGAPPVDKAPVDQAPVATTSDQPTRDIWRTDATSPVEVAEPVAGVRVDAGEADRDARTPPPVEVAEPVAGVRVDAGEADRDAPTPPPVEVAEPVAGVRVDAGEADRDAPTPPPVEVAEAPPYPLPPPPAADRTAPFQVSGMREAPPVPAQPEGAERDPEAPMPPPTGSTEEPPPPTGPAGSGFPRRRRTSVAPAGLASASSERPAASPDPEEHSPITPSQRVHWRQVSLVAALSFVLVFAGAGLAFWGIWQAFGSADDDPDNEAESVADGDQPEATATVDGEEDVDGVEDQPEATPAGETLVTTTEGLPSELQELAAARVEEGRDGRSYEMAGIVATTNAAGQRFYAALGASDAGMLLFFFLDDEFVGNDWALPVRRIESLASIEGGVIRVVYLNYGAGDEDCCPSLDAFPVIYTNDGGFGSDNPNPPETIFAD